MKLGSWIHQGLAALLLIVAFAVTAQAQQPFEDGVAAYKRGNYATALRIFRPLAKQGSATAQFSLGVIYDNGQGVVQDDGETAKWYRKAAEQGHAKAQNNLGAMYDDGQGVTQDYVQAYKWYSLAAASHPPGEDRDQAVRNRDLIEGKMTPAQVAEAQRLARKWKPK